MLRKKVGDDDDHANYIIVIVYICMNANTGGGHSIAEERVDERSTDEDGDEIATSRRETADTSSNESEEGTRGRCKGN